jgi:DNA-binding NarL/FixJ family response regulator
MERSIRVLVVDDHPLVREGEVAAICAQPDMTVVAEAGDGPQAVALFRQYRPDVTLLDLGLPGLGGVEVMRAIRAEFPESRFVVLTVHAGDEDIRRALQAGAQGYLFKSASRAELLDAVRAVHAGRQRLGAEVARALEEESSPAGLTAREVSVLRLLARGLTNREIGHELGVAESTAKWFVKSILNKLAVDDRTAAVTAALQRGVLHA